MEEAGGCVHRARSPVGAVLLHEFNCRIGLIDYIDYGHVSCGRICAAGAPCEDNHITGFDEKPHVGYQVSMGVYALNERVLPIIPQGKPFGFDELVLALLDAGEHVASYRHEGYWLDIGRPDDYEQAINDFEQIRHRLLPKDEAGK